LGSAGRLHTPIFIFSFDEAFPVILPLAMLSKISVKGPPKKIDIIAGGASFAPRRCSFPEQAAEQRSSSA
jgi:hypothetical protein